MLPDDDVCYRAIASRDRRFEGRFVVGVTSTGIYCRPGCPARVPKRENVQFFALAAVAENEGFRPCKRCRPEAHLLTSAWTGVPSTVARAMRMIGEGALDATSVSDLAERLGVGERHLRRLFDRYVGAPPLAIASSRRLHFARTLVEGTPMPLTQIALAAGYPSVRRFNHAFRAVFRATPTELRHAKTRRARGAGDEHGIVLRLSYRPPFAWKALLSFLGARAILGVEEVSESVYRRSFAIDVDGVVSEGILEAHIEDKDDHAVLLELPAIAPRAIGDIAIRARRLFDLAADPITIAKHLARDPFLAPSVAHASARGLRVPGAWDRFELVIRAILGQQITVRAAATLAGRIVTTFGTKLAKASGAVTHIFPTPRVLASAKLEAIGLTRARAEAIRTFAHAVARDEITLDDVGARDALLRFPGIGPWTADYVAMRALGDPDAFPAGDWVLQRMLGERDPAGWSPWRSYAAMHLWRRAAETSANAAPRGRGTNAPP